jgi:hypothetical protein
MINVKEEIMNVSVTEDDLTRLSQYHNKSCISIYIPTHRMGEATLNGQDALNLKNQLKQIRSKLSSHGIPSREIEKLTEPINGLINDSDFWRHQSNGLAVFASEDVFEKYCVPENFEEMNYLSSEFYLKPLLPLFNENGHFFLLTLRKDEVKLYEGSRFGLAEIDVEGVVPARLEDSVGYDYEQKQLQFRTLFGGNKPGTFHGHGEGETKNKNELLIFLRDVDKGIMSKLHDKQEIPLLVCCLDYIFPIFKEASTHKNLFPQFISVNPSDLDKKLLHERAWNILDPYFRKEFLSRKTRYLTGIDKGKASSNIREIIPAALTGKVDTLFLEKNIDMFGIYDPSTGGITIQEEQNMSNVSLMNLAAKKVYEQGGVVYLLNMEQMPDITAPINALFRY